MKMNVITIMVSAQILHMAFIQVFAGLVEIMHMIYQMVMAIVGIVIER